MTMVAMLHPADFPEMNGPAPPLMKSSRGVGSSTRMPSRNQSRRPQRPSRQVAPSGWTMCECEADKEWVLCDQAEARTAELAERFQQHFNQDTEEVSKVSVGKGEDLPAANQDSSKEDTMRRVQQQLAEEEDEMMRAREEILKAREEVIRAREEMKRVEEEIKSKQEIQAAQAKKDESDKEEEISSKVSSRKQLSKAERKAAWKAAQEMGHTSCSLVEMHQVLEKQRAGQSDLECAAKELTPRCTERTSSPPRAKSQRAKSRSRQPEVAEEANKLEGLNSKERTGSPGRAKSQRAKSRRSRRAFQEDDF